MKADRIESPKTEDEFNLYYDLRWRVLRSPLGLPRGSERDDLDDQHQTIHRAAFIGRYIVSVGRLHLSSPDEAQVRYMATDPGFLRRGIGKAVLVNLEEEATRLNVVRVVLNAREEAVSFYTNSNYNTVGDKFFPVYLPNVAHFRMEKLIER